MLEKLSKGSHSQEYLARQGQGNNEPSVAGSGPAPTGGPPAPDEASHTSSGPCAHPESGHPSSQGQGVGAYQASQGTGSAEFSGLPMLRLGRGQEDSGRSQSPGTALWQQDSHFSTKETEVCKEFVYFLGQCNNDDNELLSQHLLGSHLYQVCAKHYT